MGNCVRKPVQCGHVSSNFSSDTAKALIKVLPSEEMVKIDTSGITQHVANGFDDTSVHVHKNLRSFSFGDLKRASNNFEPDSILGEGGFGCVFKGWINESTLAPCKPGFGMAVAIKKLNEDGFQGHKEWLTEVNYLGQLRHENLVKLIGYCSESDSRLLVYEFMPKGSLEHHLFRKGVEPLDWATRMNIAVGVARGLSCLHNLESKVIYRDLKSSNVLLDMDFNVRLSDFGLARDGPTGDDTHVSTKVVGTQGYAAPEYVASGHLTTKSDVYSFGVVLLELLSGRRSMYDEKTPGTKETLVNWAKPFLCDTRRVLRIMDTKLGGQYPKKAAQAAAALALHCVHTDSKNRPHMIEVLATLETLHTLKDAPRIRGTKSDNCDVGRRASHRHRKTKSVDMK